MSNTVHYTGKLKKVEIVENLENTAKLLLEENNIDPKLDVYTTYISSLTNNLYKKYVVVGNDIYFILEKDDFEGGDNIFQSTYLGDGIYSFNVRYYNRCFGFDEAIEHAIKHTKT